MAGGGARAAEGARARGSSGGAALKAWRPWPCVARTPKQSMAVAALAVSSSASHGRMGHAGPSRLKWVGPSGSAR
jgi:hypothetical protein